jgi:hypothetical protein
MAQPYEVFISFKNTDENGMTDDYHLALNLFDALVGRGIETFFAPLSLRMNGRDKFSSAIDDALDQAKVLVVVGTTKENIESRWVRYEWESFLTDHRSGLKPSGQLFTLLRGVNTNELPRALRQHQSFDWRDNAVLVDSVENALQNNLGQSTTEVTQSELTESEEQNRLLDRKYQSFYRTPTSVEFDDFARAYSSRAAAESHLRLDLLFQEARLMELSGLSLNFICQKFDSTKLIEQIETGAEVQALFLAPECDAMKSREEEEGYPPGRLSALTILNIEHLLSVQNQLSQEAKPRLRIATSSRPIRFNISILDRQLCIVQPYLPANRGVDSPTMVFFRRSESGLYSTFERCYEVLWSEKDENYGT